MYFLSVHCQNIRKSEDHGCVWSLFSLEAGLILPLQWPSVAQLQCKIRHPLKSNSTQGFLCCSYLSHSRCVLGSSIILLIFVPSSWLFRVWCKAGSLCLLHIFLKLTSEPFFFTLITEFHKHQEQPVNLFSFLVHFHLGLSKTQNNYL